MRTRFRINHKIDGHVFLTPVPRGSRENEAFFGGEPRGQIALTVESAETLALFEAGKEIVVDFGGED